MPNLLKLWLIFCQTTTIFVAVIFVLTTLKPFWLNKIFYNEHKIVDSLQDSNKTQYIESKLVNNEDEMVEFKSNNLRYAAARAMPSVVHIYTTQNKITNPHNLLLNDPFFQKFFSEEFNLANPNNQPKTGLGSGVIVDNKGNIITNHHVIEKADKIEIALADGRKAGARIVGTDPETDLAVLQVNLTGLNKIIFGESKSVFVGDTVLAIGNPFGVGQTATQGIISGLGRNKLNINTFENFIQTDAAINPGNSGGALVNSKGHLIGINTAIYSQSGGSVGIGFAIPTSTVEVVLKSILVDGKVTRGFLGVQPAQVTESIARGLKLNSINGAFINRIVTNGPADKAGLIPGDIVIKIGESSVLNKEDLLSKVANIKPGSKVDIEVVRNGKKLTMPTIIGERPK